VLFLKKMSVSNSASDLKSCQTTYMLLPVAFMSGCDAPVELLMFILVDGEKVSVLVGATLKNTSETVADVLFVHTTYALVPEAVTRCSIESKESFVTFTGSLNETSAKIKIVLVRKSKDIVIDRSNVFLFFGN